MKIRIRDILSEKRISMIFNLLAIASSIVYLYYTNIGIQKVIPVLIIYACICVAYYVVYIYTTKKKLERFIQLFENLEKPYYIGGQIKSDGGMYSRVCGEIIKKSCKAMLETVSEYETANDDYRDFIEQWVHRTKTPVSVIRLICNNNPSEAMSKIQCEIQRIENETEKILFFSKSRDFQNDYILKEVAVKDVVNEAVVANKSLLIENNAKIRVEAMQSHVLSDPKWLCFILSQFLTNSVKYKNGEGVSIDISCEEKDGDVYIYYSDDGIGIPSGELSRIYEKGFTGTNGRKTSESSGFGLYLCKTLCDKLAIKLTCTSFVGKGTMFILKIHGLSDDFR